MARQLSSDGAAELRQVAFGVAYRILGDPTEAEDIAQQTIERYLAAEEAGERPDSYVATIAARRSLTLLRDRGNRRRILETYGLPLPLTTRDDAADARIDLGYGLLVLSFSLSPLARAVFILREAFELSFDEIADAVQSTPAACRQVMSRARRALRSSDVARRRMVDQGSLARLMTAIRAGDLSALVALLSEEVVLHSDGGGRAPAFGRPVAGRGRIARFLAASPRLLPGELTGELRETASGVLLMIHAMDAVVLCVSVEAVEDGIGMIYAISDPHKLARLGPIARR